jgi:large repetitive protein
MPLSASAQTAPPLGSAASFAILGGSAVTDSGSSIVTGNLGVSPGDTVSGFAAGAVRIGTIYRDDALARQAQKDAAAAYRDLASRTCTPFSGTTLGPGVYCLTSPLSGVLTLNAAGDPNAVWIFRGATLVTTTNAAVRVINGGYEGNVFWQVGGSATLGAGTAFVGNILALTNITLEKGATLSGRALAQTGTVKLDANKVSLCCDPKDPIVVTAPTLLNASVGTEYKTPKFIAAGGTPPYTYTFSGEIPSGLAPSGDTLSGKPTAGGTYHFFVTATDSHGCTGTSEDTIVVCGIVIDPPELPKTCTVDQKITASGGTSPYTFSATGLPDGVTFDPSTAVLFGAPLTCGCYTVIVTATDKNGCTASRTYTICRIEIEPTTLPNGVVGTPYPETTITASCGTPPYTCKFSGDVPPGLSPTGCTISGTPTAAECVPFTVTVTDILGFTCSRTYTPCIGPAPTIASPPMLPRACAGALYSQVFTATGGQPPYTFTVVQPSPFDLTFNGPVLSGVPEATGGVTVTVKVQDYFGSSTTKSYNFSSDKVIVNPDALPDAQAGVFYDQMIFASGGEGPYTYAAPALPACGLSLDPGSGRIFGTPSAGCSAFFPVTGTDKNGCAGEHDYQIDVACPSINFSPAALPGGNVSLPYSQPIAANGGIVPYTFTLASGALPPGLTLDSGGTLSGIPTTIGTYCFVVGVTDAGGCRSESVTYTVVISASTCPGGTVITLSPPSLPFAATGAPYNQLITASGGTAPYTFAVTSGTLPPGLVLNAATGLVSGTPTQSGVFTMTITATDANGCLGSMGCRVVMTVDIPATTEWGMALLASVLVLMGVVTMRGRA